MTTSLTLTDKPGSLPSLTVPQVFSETVSKYGHKIAIRQTVRNEALSAAGKPVNTFEHVTYTWNQYNESARAFAKSLIAVGVKPQRAVTIQGANSAPWLFANLGTILAGGISAGVYATNAPNYSVHAVKQSGADVVVVEDEKQLQKYKNLDSQQSMGSTAVKCFVVWGKATSKAVEGSSAPVYSWDEFIDRGKDVLDDELNGRINSQDPKKVCSLIYTSGTTAMPKGAALTHDNLTWTAFVTGKIFELHQKHHGLSYLPLSHIAAQQIDAVTPAIFGYRVDIAPSDALRGDNLKLYLADSRPTYKMAVPRVWEKFMEGIAAKEAQPPQTLKGKVVKWINAKATRVLNFATAQPTDICSKLMYYTVNKILKVISTGVLKGTERLRAKVIRDALGLDQCVVAATGSAPLSTNVTDFFARVNVRIIDIYGLSETSGPITVAIDKTTPKGSCGKALPGIILKISDQDEKGEGEICVKGRNIFDGYWKDQANTIEAFDEEGYFKTGDKGKLDQDGNLFITGRLKELIKTSGGENIPPVIIEQKIKQELPIISQAVVIGNQRKFLTCLITLETTPDSDGNPSAKLSKKVLDQLEQLGSSARTIEEAAVDPKLQKFLNEGIERANKKAESGAQVIGKMTVLPEDFSVLNGLMTPTLKLKRSEIEKYFAEQINKMYAEA